MNMTRAAQMRIKALSATFIVDTSGTPQCKTGANFLRAYFLGFHNNVFLFVYKSEKIALVFPKL
jgi:hypothetical protein